MKNNFRQKIVIIIAMTTFGCHDKKRVFTIHLDVPIRREHPDQIDTRHQSTMIDRRSDFLFGRGSLWK
jgi:hypothetical protein